MAEDVQWLDGVKAAEHISLATDESTDKTHISQLCVLDILMDNILERSCRHWFHWKTTPLERYLKSWRSSFKSMDCFLEEKVPWLSRMVLLQWPKPECGEQSKDCCSWFLFIYRNSSHSWGIKPPPDLMTFPSAVIAVVCDPSTSSPGGDSSRHVRKVMVWDEAAVQSELVGRRWLKGCSPRCWKLERVLAGLCPGLRHA